MARHDIVNEVNTDKRGTATQAVVAVAVLVAICLVCGLLLALCNDLLYVTPEEKFNRAMQKVYPDFQLESGWDERPNAQFSQNDTYGSVSAVYKSTDGAYVLETTGIGGFNGGTVTLYVAVSGDEEPVIKGWTITANAGQSFIGNITENHQKTWFIGDSISEVQATDGFGSGATFTENAICNAINMASYYCMNALGLGSNPEGEALQAAMELLGADYASYTLAGRGNVLKASAGSAGTVAKLLSTDTDTLSYLFTGTGDKGDVQAFVYGEDENRKIVIVTAEGIVKSDNVADGDAIIEAVSAHAVYAATVGSKEMFAVTVERAVGESGTDYTVAGLGIGTVPGTYVIKVTVAEENGVGKVTAITMVTNGFVPGYPSEENANKLLTSLVGVTATTVDGVYSSDHVAGATESASIITIAVKAALAQFDATVGE